MDELHPRLIEAISDIKEIKVKVDALVTQGAVQGYVLDKHEQRSTQLEARVTPLEVAEAHRMKTKSLWLGSSGLLIIPTAVYAILRLLGKA